MIKRRVLFLSIKKTKRNIFILILNTNSEVIYKYTVRSFRRFRRKHNRRSPFMMRKFGYLLSKRLKKI